MSSDVNKVLKLNVKNKSVCMAYCKLHRVSSIFFAETSHTFPTYQCLQKGVRDFFQSRFSAHCLILASKNYSTKGLRLHPCTAISTEYLLRLLKISGYQECYLFFKSIKHVFPLTGTFN